MQWLADMYPASQRGSILTPRLDEIRPLPPLHYLGFIVSHVKIRFLQGRMTDCTIDLSISGLDYCLFQLKALFISKRSPRATMTHAIRAILLAKATTVLLVPLRLLSC